MQTCCLTLASPGDRRYRFTYRCFSLNFTMQTGRLLPLQVMTIDATVSRIGVFLLILLCRRAVLPPQVLMIGATPSTYRRFNPNFICRRAVFPLQALLPIYPLQASTQGFFSSSRRAPWKFSRFFCLGPNFLLWRFLGVPPIKSNRSDGRSTPFVSILYR